MRTLRKPVRAWDQSNTEVVLALLTPGRVRWRLAAAMVLIGVGVVGGLAGPVRAAEAILAVGLGLAGGLVLCTTALAVLRLAVQERQKEIALLHERLRDVETQLRTGRTRLHEIHSTVAGIASASRLISGQRLDIEREGTLREMLQAELERLERLFAERAPDERRTVDLDEILGQLVASHLLRGHGVAWQPSGAHALGRADDIAEAVNVLLENAARHGSPDRISLTVQDRGATVDVAVADAGPGVPPELRPKIFEWGARGSGSDGQGIGLHVAAELARDLGGILRLDDESVFPGARFVLSLPSAPPGVRRDSNREAIAGVRAQ